MKEALYARIEAFLGEFRFVSRYVKISRFSKRPTVRRIDLDLMDRYGWTDAWIRRNRNDMGSTRFFLIGANGQELNGVKPYDVVKPKFSLRHPADTWFYQDIDGETVYEAIQKLDPDRVKYVLEIKDLFGGSRGEDFDPDFGLEVTLHKVPSGRSFSEWLDKIREIATKELQDELTKVNQI